MAFPLSKDKKPAGQNRQSAMGPPQAMPQAPQQPPIPGSPVNPFAALQGQVSQGPAMPMPPVGMGGPPGMPPMPGQGMPGMDLDGGGDMPPDAMIMAILTGQQPMDPYATMPGEPDMGFQGAGVADPQMGLEQMIKLLMLAQAGVAPGSPLHSSSGLVPDPPSNAMAGLGPPDGGGFGMY